MDLRLKLPGWRLCLAGRFPGRTDWLLHWAGRHLRRLDRLLCPAARRPGGPDGRLR